ncbi:vomeronasal type-2 receptor 26-like [Hyla sarda]|uniref:vomeronasal type-2 receptor 26-like n=1 Tax=Hyla sarda TaxID=327740 RepID=UPI0024C271C5|nr:vomeronasal type-2 receptor 26-like [Hyla sarda]
MTEEDLESVQQTCRSLENTIRTSGLTKLSQMNCDFFLNSTLIHILLVICVTSYGQGPKKSPSQSRLSQNNLITGLEYEYYQRGDFIIGGLFSVNIDFTFIAPSFQEHIGRLLCLCPNVKRYMEIQTFIFAIDEVNKDPDLLPNITLGYHIFDTCGDKMMYIHKMLNILSGEKDVPNYNCRIQHSEVAGFVSEDFEPAEILNLYSHPKVSVIYKF